MTGPEHYLAAEELLLTADAYDQDHAPQTAAARRATAQVHATLALAAATATQADVSATVAGISHTDVDAWDDAICSGSAYDGMTNADVVGADELHEMDQAAEFAHDAADDERRAEAGEGQ